GLGLDAVAQLPHLVVCGQQRTHVVWSFVGVSGAGVGWGGGPARRAGAGSARGAGGGGAKRWSTASSSGSGVRLYVAPAPPGSDCTPMSRLALRPTRQ